MANFKNPLVPQKKDREPTYNYTQAQIDAIRYEAVRKGIINGIYICNSMYSTAMLTVMHDKLGFGRVRLARIFGWVQSLFNEIVDRRISYKDLAQVLRDECRVNLIVERPDGVQEDVLKLFYDIEHPTVKVRMDVRK